MDREFLIKGIHDPFVKAYFDFMVDTAVIFGANRTRAEAEMMDALHFEMRLASVSVNQVTDVCMVHGLFPNRSRPDLIFHF